jgi:hypothetical protein
MIKLVAFWLEVMAFVKAVAKREDIITSGRDFAKEKTLSTILGIASIKSMLPTKMKTMMVKKITSFNSKRPPRLNNWLMFSGIIGTQEAIDTLNPVWRETITSPIVNL